MKKQEIPFRGLCTALVTPFRADGSVDAEAFSNLVRRQIAGGADALLVLGTTGESATLTDEERRMLVRETVRIAAGCVPVIAGTGTNDTARTAAFTRFASEAGCDAVLVAAPYYNRPTPDGLIRHFTETADAAGCPVILYNIPSRTGVDLPVPLVKELARHPHIAGIKEASGSIDRAADLCAVFSGEDFAVYAGNDGEIVPVCSVGGMGAVSVLANLLPREVGEMCRAMLDGEWQTAAAIHNRLLPLARALFAETNPAPVKAAMAMLGLAENVLRLPLVPVRSETEARLRAALDSLGLL
ncbi:MAG: 4-hydroxy-tetrahydrodipicolinate synthase [Clostridia bacterium]|nr:4-hydroxy-tetrahydrodipicolinate synthase [Clostridia bacterium]